jgi:hypothetical protein
MKDKLPQKINKVECGIINLENYDQDGSHWTAYYKDNSKKYYFDSYGWARPPKELIKYLGSENLYYNEDHIQNYNSPPFCGHLCLIILKKLSEDDDYETALKTCAAALRSAYYF